MDKTEAERILAALKSGTPLVGRHKAAEALEWALGPRWISVDETLPEDGVPVLVFVIWNSTLVVASLDVDMWWPKNGAPLKHVTHWQPLPVAPEGRRDEI